jgi:eukaryotic-like serine/threonine-protein kinase
LALFPAAQAWLVTLGAPAAAAGAMDDRHVYVPLQDDRLVALDRERGATVWTREIGTRWPPIAGARFVFVAGSDELHALDPETGDSSWRVPLDGPAGAPMTLGSAMLAVVGENGTVTAHRVADGARIWQRPLAAMPRSGLVFGGDEAAYLTLDEGRVAALRLTTGEVLWETRLPGRLSEPGWAVDRVLVGSDGNVFYALDAEDGSLEWQWRLGGDVIGAAAWEDVVFVASLDNSIRAVNRGNGNQRWRKDTGTRPLLPPLAFHGVAVVSGANATLTAFAARDGGAAGTWVAPNALHGPPLVDPVLEPFRVALAVVMRDGRVAGLAPVSMQFSEQPLTPLAGLPGRTLPRELRPGPAP